MVYSLLLLGCGGDSADEIQTVAGIQPPKPPPIAGISQQRFSAGGTQSCVISGTERLYCWGENLSGQIGTGVPPPPPPPTQGGTLAELTEAYAATLLAQRPDVPSPTLIGGEATWQYISAGYHHTCGIRSDSSLYCWGQNSSGELGIDSGAVSLGQGTGQAQGSTPTMTSTMMGWRQVSAGRFSHTCAIKSEGTLWCWGEGSSGRLGTVTTVNQSSPVQVGSDSDWREVSAGWEHTCATKTNGTLWCWGSAEVGQIGLGPATGAGRNEATFPHQVGTDTDWGLVYAGDFHTCALKAGGEAWCWGDGIYGALGIGDPVDYADQSSLMALARAPTYAVDYVAVAPVRVGTDSDWVYIGGGRYHSCGIKSGGQLWCWGALYRRSIRGGPVPLSPVRLGADRSWSLLSTGDHHVCAVSIGNLLFCWGSNESGAIGNSTTTSSDTPIQVNSFVIQ